MYKLQSKFFLGQFQSMKTTMERAHPTGQPIRLSRVGWRGLDASSLSGLRPERGGEAAPQQLVLKFFRPLLSPR